MALMPGYYNEQSAPNDPHDYHRYIVKRCAENDIIDLEKSFAQRAGYRTLAIFTANVPGGEVHFAHLNQHGFWEDKFFFRGVRNYKTIADIEKDSGFAFKSYALSPINLVPKFCEQTAFDLETLHEGKDTLRLCCLQQDPGLSYVQVVYDVQRQHALLGGEKRIAPMPALPSKFLPFETVRPSIEP